MLRVGIDFDNTIANYDDVFSHVAYKLKLINKKWHGNKSDLKKKNYKRKKHRDMEEITRASIRKIYAFSQSIDRF